MRMGRRRRKDLDLPQRMRRVGAAFYYDTGAKPRKWIALGSDKAKALTRWAELRGADSSGRSVGTLIDKYLAQSSELSDNTLRNYRNLAAIVRKFFGTAPVDQVRSGHIQEFHDRHPRKMLARNVVIWFKQVLKKAVQWEWIASNPADKVEVRPQRKRDRYLTDAEYVAIRERLAPQFQVAVDLADRLALRVSDVVGLRLSDVRDGRITIMQKKTRKAVVYEVTPEIEEVLAGAMALKRPVRGLYVICNRRGAPYAEKTVSQAFKDAANALGIRDVRFHDLRAKSASDEQATAQQRLGHRSAAATLSYLRKPVVVTPIRRKIGDG